MEIKKGLPASPGVCVGRAFLLDSEEFNIPERFINESDLTREIDRFDQAVALFIKELESLYKKLPRRGGEETLPILEAYIKMVQDKYLHAQIKEQIKNYKYTAEYATSRVFKQYSRALYSTDNSFLASRIQDINDIERRLLRNLLEKKREELTELKEPVVIIAHDLTPIQTISLERKKVKGFAIDVGGYTSHTSIIARSMGLPAVVGLNTISLEVSGGDQVIIDGNNGIVIIDPDEETIKRHTALEKSFFFYERRLLVEERKHLAQTKDGYEVQLYANIELPTEVPLALRYGADGIGLLRTESLYYHPERLPAEQEHFGLYKKIAMQMDNREVIIRTLDLGADKLPIGGGLPEKNPFLGHRAIRFCRQHTEVFKTQLRAILRAAEFGNISLMVPMVSSLEEVRWIKEMLHQVSTQLTEEHIPFNRNCKLGIMIEVPSAALIMDLLVKEVDFFSIGTNDLIQYTIAIDRGNERVASLYQPTHPAVLRLIKMIIDTGHQNGKRVGMCGEMAGDYLFTILLLGMGLKLFSLVPVRIPEIKKIIRSVTITEAREVAQEAMSLQDAQKTLSFLQDYTKKIIPQLF